MALKLYVGGLPYKTTEEEINELFAQAGTVTKVSLITDRETGNSKGFAFVEMSTEDEAQNGIKMFNGYALDGRTLVVNEARPMEDRKPAGGGYNGGGNRGGGYNGGGGNRY